jgi:hypothetical protein
VPIRKYGITVETMSPMSKPSNNSRSEAETDPANAGPKGRLKGVNHTMKTDLLFVGLDVHAQSITVAVAENDRQLPRLYGIKTRHFAERAFLCSFDLIESLQRMVGRC